MNIKKSYEVGDVVWIHGVGRSNRLTEGTVIKVINIDYGNYDAERKHYVIAIPTHIEPIHEIREWETMSQDEVGPLGMFRDLKNTMAQTNKFLRQAGYHTEDDMEDEVAPEKINAVLDKIEKSRTDTIFKPKKSRFQRPKKSNRRTEYDAE